MNKDIRTVKGTAIGGEKTAIDYKIDHWYEKMPKVIKDLIDAGQLRQWRKHPNIIFVKGVWGARITFDDKKCVIKHTYLHMISDDDDYIKFVDIYRNISKQLPNTTERPLY